MALALGPQIAANWPIVATILSGILAFGSLKTDVGDLKAAQATAHTDHDLIVQIDAGDKARDQRLNEMHDDIKELLRHQARQEANHK